MDRKRNRDEPAGVPGGLTKHEHAAILLTAGISAARPDGCLLSEMASDGVVQAHALFDHMDDAKWRVQRQTMDDRLLQAEHHARRLYSALAALGAKPYGYCSCPSGRVPADGAPDASHTGECREARAAISSYEETG